MPSSEHFRAYARRPTSLPTLLQCDSVSSNLTAELIDLSLGGACVVLGDPLAMGTTLRLRLDAPELWEPLFLSGTVVWSKATTHNRIRHGLRFTPESANSLAVLTELLGTGNLL